MKKILRQFFKELAFFLIVFAAALIGITLILKIYQFLFPGISVWVCCLALVGMFVVDTVIRYFKK